MVICFRVRKNASPNRLTLHVSSISPLPKSYVDAFNDPNWHNTINDEYNALLKIILGLLQGTGTADLLFYVDDIVLTSSEILLERIIASLNQEMFFSQRKYATEILERAHMVGCNPSRTPINTKSKLGDDGDLVSDPTLYQSLAGSLQYLTFTRPDISYAVQQVCLYMHDPREPYFSAVKRILRYVRGTLDHGLQLFSSSTTTLCAYSDADWVGCPTTRRSTSSYCVFLGNNLLFWSSKRQPTLSCSSAEAEYRGVANAVAETCWLRNLLRELHTLLSSATLFYCDNVSVVYLSSNSVQHQRTKHIEIDIHLVKDLVAAGQVQVLHVPSRYQYADIFTKGLPSTLFEEFRTSLSIWCPPALTAGEYTDSKKIYTIHVFQRHTLFLSPLLDVNSRGKALAKDVDFEKIARRTPGFTEADLQNLMNEAAILAALHELKEISNTLSF
ncbi:ribonuclease H-like domain-containing protein [Tanacetum coccineum]